MFLDLLTGGLGLLGSLLGGDDAGKATIDAAGLNRGLLGDLKTEGMGYIDQGNTGAKSYLDQILKMYSPAADQGARGAGLYADALGINGRGGSARARGAYQNAPGYQFAMDQGLQALDRGAAARGTFQSGGTGIDEMKYAHGLADQGWNSWLDRLGSPNTVLGGAMDKKAMTLGSLGDLEKSTAGGKLDFTTGITNGLLGVNNQEAQGQEANYNEAEKKKSGIFGSLGNFAGGFKGMGGLGGYL